MKKKTSKKTKKNREEIIQYTIMHPDIPDLDIYYHSLWEDCKPYLSHNPSSEELLQIYHSIHKCPDCGGDIELHEHECMGDGSYIIKCKNCGRSMERSQYDWDITKWEDVLEFCIRDWNAGLTGADIKKKNDAFYESIHLQPQDFHWFPYYPNNMPCNGKDGWIALLFRRDSDGEIYCLKWTIRFQYKETRDGLCTDEIESYNLFMQRYFQFKGPMHYPKPSKTCPDLPDDDDTDTLTAFGVNDPGDFVRNYSTLQRAKKGALQRSGFYGFNKNTLITEQE